MGATGRLLLPYPELNDPANVPIDMKELCDQIEKVLGGFLPPPVFKQQLDPPQNASATSPSWNNLNPQATITNPHTALFLLVSIEMGLAVSAVGNVVYTNLFTSGHSGVAMTTPGRTQDTYEAISVGGMATVAPGGTLAVRAQVRRLNTSTMPTIPSVRIGLLPVGWLKAGTIS